ncbi:MAG: hypothetical protein JWM40_161, partial [Frankiales bacterium]|nr:hypothetical protein [Frankiales bacterium]
PQLTKPQLSDVVVDPGTASARKGAAVSGQVATLNGFACGRSTDVNGLTVDSCGRMIALWPAQARESEGTYASQQTSGPRLRSKVCAAAVKAPVKVPLTKPVATPHGNGGSGALAATGAPAGLALLAIALVCAGVVLRRRRLS